jgi:hypothetical protein
LLLKIMLKLKLILIINNDMYFCIVSVDLLVSASSDKLL